MTTHRFDYDHVDWTFVAGILNENSMRLSRTRQGVSNTETSSEKLPLLLTGQELRDRSAANEARVHEYLHASRHDPSPSSAQNIHDLLFRIAEMTNDGLLPAGPLRTWPIDGKDGVPSKVKPADLPQAIDAFCETLYRRWPELAVDPVPLAAFAEWELNGGSLHPFYDGCGRISRSFGALLLVRGRSTLPLYEDTATYFTRGHRGVGGFEQYVRDRLLAGT